MDDRIFILFRLNLSGNARGGKDSVDKEANVCDNVVKVAKLASFFI